jgi:hypothetical protein
MTAIPYALVVASWLVGVGWGVYLVLCHVDADAVDDRTLRALDGLVLDRVGRVDLPRLADRIGRTLATAAHDSDVVAGLGLAIVATMLLAPEGVVGYLLGIEAAITVALLLASRTIAIEDDVEEGSA